jgi:A/G-specific adenine glycosylase
MTNEEFKEFIWQKGRELYREMPWRQDTRPYYVLVSELMLQQTQVDRVIPKFESFISLFPDEKSLAKASLSDVLKAWQGLGYNRRAKFLHEAAKKITERSEFPEDEKGLIDLPGVGKNTAGAILAYSFNQQVIFVETNIRTVYFHHFFGDENSVDDKQVVEKLTQTIDNEHPREFYWALMDYGSFLKRSGYGRIVQGKHYKKQSKLKGSVREVRGQIISLLTKGDAQIDDLKATLNADERFDPALS